MRLLARRARQQPVCRKRPKDELATQNFSKDLHHSRMLDHINENLSLIQQIPDPPLQVNLVRMGAMKMRCPAGLIRKMMDDPVGLSNLLCIKNRFKQMIARPLQ